MFLYERITHAWQPLLYTFLLYNPFRKEKQRTSVNKRESALRKRRRPLGSEHFRSAPGMSRRSVTPCEPSGPRSRLSVTGELRKPLKFERRQRQRRCWCKPGSSR